MLGNGSGPRGSGDQPLSCNVCGLGYCGGQALFSKAYQVEGQSQGGKMFWGGPFAMKNAIQQSTKLALDEILRDFIADYNRLDLAQR